MKSIRRTLLLNVLLLLVVTLGVVTYVVYRTAAGETFALEIGAQSDINSNLQVIQAVADSWKQNGIQSTTIAIPGNLDWREVGAQMKGVYIGGSTPGYSAYDMLLSNQISAQSNRWRSPNMGGVVSPGFDDLYNRVLGTIDDNRRNEIAAQVRLRGGKRLSSPALIADGNHARIDGFVSLGVVASAVAVALGAQIADPIIGLCITALILRITAESWNTVRGHDQHH